MLLNGEKRIGFATHNEKQCWRDQYRKKMLRETKEEHIEKEGGKKIRYTDRGSCREWQGNDKNTAEQYPLYCFESKSLLTIIAHNFIVLS